MNPVSKYSSAARGPYAPPPPVRPTSTPKSLPLLPKAKAKGSAKRDPGPYGRPYRVPERTNENQERVARQGDREYSSY